MKTIDKLNKILKEYKGESITLTEDSTFDSMGFDSLDKVELLMKVEEEFGVVFDDDLKIDTIAQLIAKIESLKK